MQKLFLIILISFITNLSVHIQKVITGSENDQTPGNYTNVNGIKMYYEVHGEREPLLLMHGNGGSTKGHDGRFLYPTFF